MIGRLKSSEDFQDRNYKVLVFLIVAWIGFCVLGIKLFYLQYIQYSENFQRSENNRIRKMEITAERGFIYDRHGHVLVYNRPSYQIVIESKLLPKTKSGKDSLFKTLLGIHDTAGIALFDSASLDTAFQRSVWIRNRPIRIYEDASPAEVALIEERSHELPGVYTIVEARREYPYGTLAAHALGYTSEISEEQLAKEEFKGKYSSGDRIGQKGLEQEYDEEFRGKNGLKVVEVNAFGRIVSEVEGMGQQEAVSGLSLVSTLDLHLQQVAEEAFPDSIRGAIVALDPRNGEILAMVSSPRMDPNVFSLKRKERNRGWAKVALDSTRPLLNRAIGGVYPPASVFKLVTSGAGLEHGILTPYKKYAQPCKGGFRFGARYQKCWGTHGSLNVENALRLSCDVYFYQAGLEIDMARINEFGRRFGLGEELLGIDIPGERRGWLPDSASFNKRNRRNGWRWARGLILNLAIGQGQLVTPLQQAVLIGSLATNAGVYRPHLMKELRNSDGETVRVYTPEIIRPGNMSQETHRVLMAGLDSVVNHPRGTGRRGALPDVRVGGKTGSGEWKTGEKTHAWFAAVAPLEAPEIAVAVIMEAAGGGGAKAAPVANKVLRAYFDEKKKNEQKSVGSP